MSLTKQCGKCKEIYPATLEYFYKKINGKYNLRGRCKSCEEEANTDYRKRNPHIYRNSRLKYDYGITLDDYNKMFEEQQGCCKICGRHQINFKRRLAVDHNHKTTEVRGLLCNNCNQRLGYINENPFVLIKTIKYLRGEL